MRRIPLSIAMPLVISLAPASVAAQMPSKEMAQAAAAYAAKITASAIFVSGRTLESVLDQELAPTRPLEILIKPLLRFDVDHKSHRVTCRLGQAKAIAQRMPALGCVLIVSDSAPSKARRALEVTQAPARALANGAAWPNNETVTIKPATGIDYASLGTAIDRAFVERNPKKPINTRAIVVVHKGQLVAERYADGFDKTMPLPGWSMSKTLTNALLGMRVRDGKFDLDAPARDQAKPDRAQTGESQTDESLRQPTVRNLMSMTAGIEWNEDYDNPNSHALRMLFGSADHAAVYAELPQSSNAGEHFQYASGSSNLLCKLLRQSFDSDTDYWHYPTSLFDALGMSTAILETDPSGTFVGSSYCYASARDWARLGLLFQQDGVFFGQRLLPEGWVQQSTKPVAASNGRYGHQIWLNADPDGEGDEERKWADLPADLFSMDGHEGQYCVISPSAKLVIVRLGCTKSGGFDLHGFLREVHAAASQ
jgi:CubicO group peptidase (beta-lactamase class C family)